MLKKEITHVLVFIFNIIFLIISRKLNDLTILNSPQRGNTLSNECPGYDTEQSYCVVHL